jgi:dsRNA-specific ribonuclease
LCFTKKVINNDYAIIYLQALGDVFESIIGAVFLDSNLSLKRTWQVIYHLMQNEIQEFMKDVPLQIVRRLFEYKKGIAEPKFSKPMKLDDDTNFAVPLSFKVRNEIKTVVGFGKNAATAKKAAAQKALAELFKAEIN